MYYDDISPDVIGDPHPATHPQTGPITIHGIVKQQRAV